MKDLNLKMELLNSEEMEGVTGGAGVGTILACNPTNGAQVVQCQTMEAGCSGGIFTVSSCNGTSSFAASCIPQNAFYVKCTCGYQVRAALSLSAVATASVNTSSIASVASISF